MRVIQKSSCNSKENSVSYNYSDLSSVIYQFIKFSIYPDSDFSKSYVYKTEGEVAFIFTEYDVIKFIEHGDYCRPSLDRVSGQLLIYRLKQKPCIDKNQLLSWIEQILKNLYAYHRCRNDQSYRYLNPYSLLVTKEEKLLLLDLEAESNEFVLKNMQRRAMRDHFVKPVIHIREHTKITLDLYSFGKTVQFILANVQAVPPLSKWEERRLEKIIVKCLGENVNKHYETFGQVLKDIPSPRSGRRESRKSRRILNIILIILVVLLFISGIKIRYLNKERQILLAQQKRQGGTEADMENAEVISEKNIEEEQDKEETGNDDSTENESAEVQTKKNREGPEDGMDVLSQKTALLQQYLLKNTAKDNQKVIEEGENLQREILRCLAAAYDREGIKEQALKNYQRLCEKEIVEEYLENAYLRRIQIEREQNLQSVFQTSQDAVKRIPDSYELAVMRMEVLAAAEGIEKETCIEEVEVLKNRFPNLTGETSYQEIMKKYEEENVLETKEENPAASGQENQ